MHYVNIPTDITHTHTHTHATGVQLPECSERALRSEGTQSKEGSPVLPVRVGESELTWGKAMSASSQQGRGTFHPPPPTALTSSTQPLACPRHSDTLPQRVRNPPPHQGLVKLPHCRRHPCDCSSMFLWLSPDSTIGGRLSLATPSLYKSTCLLGSLFLALFLPSALTAVYQSI